jgi:hypothetical protein
MARKNHNELTIREVEFDPKDFKVSLLSDVLAAATLDVPFARVEILISGSGPYLKQSDETISKVPLGRRVIWECAKPFELTFELPPDGNSTTKKFSGVEGKDGVYRVPIEFKNHPDNRRGELTINYEIRVFINGKWFGKDPSVIIDTTFTRFWVLVPKDPGFGFKPATSAISRTSRTKAKRGRGV